jgi:hypothetical protein
MPCVVYYNMQSENTDDSQDCDYSVPPLTVCRLRKLNIPPVIPSIGHIKPPIRMDYCRVIFVLFSTLVFVGVAACMYYNQFTPILDTSLYTPNHPSGDLLIVSLRLQTQGVANGDIPRQGDILIPIEGLRSTEKQNLSFYILSK